LTVLDPPPPKNAFFIFFSFLRIVTTPYSTYDNLF
jgi:hypothetical protein